MCANADGTRGRRGLRPAAWAVAAAALLAGACKLDQAEYRVSAPKGDDAGAPRTTGLGATEAVDAGGLAVRPPSPGPERIPVSPPSHTGFGYGKGVKHGAKKGVKHAAKKSAPRPPGGTRGGGVHAAAVEPDDDPPAAEEAKVDTQPAPPDAAPAARWNVWLEHGKQQKYKPVASLSSDGSNLLVLQISTARSDADAVTTVETGAAMEKKVRRLRQSTEPDTEQMKVYALLDRRHFKDALVSRDLELRSSPSVPADPGAPALKRLRTGVLGEVALPLTTTDVPSGTKTSIAVLVWTEDDEPVDEIIVTACLAKAGEEKKCPGARPDVEHPRMAFDPDALAGADRPPPDASLHLVELPVDDHLGVRGFFKRRDGPPMIWRLELTMEQIHRELAGGLKSALNQAIGSNSEEQLRLRGGALLSLLFPTLNNAKGFHAREEFQAFVREHFEEHGPLELPPRLFVRAVAYANGQPVYLPLGLLAVPRKEGEPPEPLGFHFRIDMPMELQSYAPAGQCLSNWVVVAPKPDASNGPLNTAVTDSELGGKDGAFDRSTRKFTPFERIFDFHGFAGAHDQPHEPTALLVVAHHSDKRIWFANDDAITALEVESTFSEPSVAVLNGCGTASSDLGDFIQRLNARGVSSQIATMTEVSGDLAAHFLKCFQRSLSAAPAAGVTLGDLYLSSISCLREESLGASSDKKYGALSLVYLLLGNGEVRLCPPRRT